LGSNVCEFVPSGTMPVILTRSPPMLAAMLVIGATVVPTSSCVGELDDAPPSSLPHPAKGTPQATISPATQNRRMLRKMLVLPHRGPPIVGVGLVSPL